MAATNEEILGGAKPKAYPGAPVLNKEFPKKVSPAVQTDGDAAGVRNAAPSAAYGKYEEEYRKYNPDPVRTPGEEEKARKKRRRAEIISAIGDGISALSNLFFTTRYAPNKYDHRNSMSEKTRVRYDRLSEDYEKKKAAYLAGLHKARQTDDTEREREWRKWLEGKRLERDEAAEERSKEMHGLEAKLKGHQIDQAEYKARAAEVEARYAPQLEESKIERNKASAGASRAAASASTARAGYYANGGGSGGKYYGKFNGEEYRTESDYNKAVYAKAKEYGIPTEEDIVTGKGRLTKTRRQRRDMRQVASDVEAKIAENEKRLGWGSKSNKFNGTDW